MKFPVFAKAVEKCDAVLRPRGVDIINILTNTDKTMFDNILHSFVGIAAVQVSRIRFFFLNKLYILQKKKYMISIA